jgi:predicted CXXCH cytochrome family protein
MSHHAAAMLPATAKTVKGNFNNQSFTHHGVTSKFYRKGGQYWVNTDGPDGKMHDYPVQYTFGVYPLQQYLLPLDRGRLQALSVVWDSRPKSQGGQRWYHLYPQDKMDSGDILHWTGIYQNWNYMCADCHSTGVNKGYEAATKTFNTRWAEVNVACESCHGPASSHLQWAQAPPAQKSEWTGKGLTRSLGQAGQWTRQTDTQPPTVEGASASEAYLESCAPCHSRRSSLTQQAQGQHTMDDYRPANLEAPNYEADGQIREEVYEYGAFLQSKMHSSGVSCRDCHDSHSLKLKASGNALCLNCHQAERFDSLSHSHHQPQSPGASCIACHMPSHTYMGVHQRHDHSFRIPRPDQSLALGVPNACNQCHQDRSPGWAAGAIQRWFGSRRKGFQTYAAAFAAARQQRPGAAKMLTQIAENPAVPALARATAVSELRHYLSTQSLPVVEKALSDPDPMVRMEALQALQSLPMEQRWQRAAALLQDPRRAVRGEAARLLGSAPEAELGAERVQALLEPVRQLQESALATADRPESHLQMGVFYAQRGELDLAEQEYRAAIQLEPRLAGSYVNLSDLYRSQQRDSEAADLLKKAIAFIPSDAGLHHALGLTLVRLKQLPAALAELQRAAQMAPDNLQYQYVLAVALESLRQPSQALQCVRRLLKRHPYHPESLMLALRLAARAGKRSEAQQYGARLQELARTDPNVAALLKPGQ